MQVKKNLKFPVSSKNASHEPEFTNEARKNTLLLVSYELSPKYHYLLKEVIPTKTASNTD
jgi:hypothetical protein